MPQPNAIRNRAIIAFLKANDWSYQLVADKFKTSRGTVAGIIFRHRHAGKVLIRSPNGKGANKTGAGAGGYSYTPTYTAQNWTAR